MKKLIFVLLLSIPFICSFSQSPMLGGMNFKRAVKRLEFKEVKYQLYNDTVTTVRLTDKCKENLLKSSVEEIYKLGQCFDNIEKNLDMWKNRLANYQYPLRSTVPMSIDRLRALVDIKETEIYNAETEKQEVLYKHELKRLKETGQLEKLVYDGIKPSE